MSIDRAFALTFYAHAKAPEPRESALPSCSAACDKDTIGGAVKYGFSDYRSGTPSCNRLYPDAALIHTYALQSSVSLTNRFRENRPNSRISQAERSLGARIVLGKVRDAICRTIFRKLAHSTKLYDVNSTWRPTEERCYCNAREAERLMCNEPRCLVLEYQVLSETR
jgi:hypothetical protein